jgi:hypothetical protein
MEAEVGGSSDDGDAHFRALTCPQTLERRVSATSLRTDFGFFAEERAGGDHHISSKRRKLPPFLRS